jgi:hypothetical protein
VTADYNESVETFTTPPPGEPPTPVVASTDTITGSSFNLAWTGGFGATSYSYTLNEAPFTPTYDTALTDKKVTFTGLRPSKLYTITLTATNSTGSVTDTVSITTLEIQPAVTPALVTALKDEFTNVTDASGATSAIATALAQNVSTETIVAATLVTATPEMFTALTKNPVFAGSTVSVPASASAAIYKNFAVSRVKVNKALPLKVNFPAADGSVKAPGAGANSKLAIDLNRDTYVPFSGAEGYGIRVVGGVQFFVTPTDASGTEVHVGDPVTFTLDTGKTVTFAVADLDIVFVPYVPPKPVVCFFGDAPVLTPMGYKRMDRMQVGDTVVTPTGTAKVELITKDDYIPCFETNPYVIPEGKFGAITRILISPRHKLKVNGKMIEARFLGLKQEEQINIVYYNLQITGGQNMVVGGVEVESLARSENVKISNELLDQILTTQYGGKIPDEMKDKCHFFNDSVSVPVRR